MWKPVTGGDQENTANQGKVVKRFKALPSSTVRVSCDLAFLLFWIRIMISLININCLPKGQFLFAEILLCLQPLKNSQTPIVFMPKTHILGWHILLPITHTGLGCRFFCVQGGDRKNRVRNCQGEAALDTCCKGQGKTESLQSTAIGETDQCRLSSTTPKTGRGFLGENRGNRRGNGEMKKRKSKEGVGRLGKNGECQ